MLSRGVNTLSALLLAATPVLAQTYEAIPPRKVGGEWSVMIEWLIGGVFLIGCLVVAFKPAKRSNLR